MSWKGGDLRSPPHDPYHPCRFVYRIKSAEVMFAFDLQHHFLKW